MQNTCAIQSITALSIGQKQRFDNCNSKLPLINSASLMTIETHWRDSRQYPLTYPHLRLMPGILIFHPPIQPKNPLEMRQRYDTALIGSDRSNHAEQEQEVVTYRALDALMTKFSNCNNFVHFSLLTIVHHFAGQGRQHDWSCHLPIIWHRLFPSQCPSSTLEAQRQDERRPKQEACP